MRRCAVTTILAVALVATAAVTAPATAASDRTETNPLRWSRVAAGQAGTLVDGGSARITRSAEGVDVEVSTNGLIPGHSYTMWVEFFNRPQLCLTPPGDHYRCGAVDFAANPLADGAARYGDGVASVGPDGSHDFRAHIPASRLPTTLRGLLSYLSFRVQTGFPVDLPTDEKHLSTGTALLTNPLGAEYHVMILDHGPYDPGRFGEAQWTTHSGGCHLEEGNIWPYLAGPCAMAQAAGFPAFPPMTLASELEHHL